MDHVSKHEGIVDIALVPLELLGKVGFASAWERLDDLGRWNQNVRLYNDHASLARKGRLICLLDIVINLQVEVVLLVEISNNTYKVASLDPKLDSPASSQTHLEEDRTFNEAIKNRLSVLVHRRTQL